MDRFFRNEYRRTGDPEDREEWEPYGHDPRYHTRPTSEDAWENIAIIRRRPDAGRRARFRRLPRLPRFGRSEREMRWAGRRDEYGEPRPDERDRGWDDRELARDEWSAGGPRADRGRENREPDYDAWAVGPHVGRGPRGYRRSDERIWEDACEILTFAGELDASGIEVRVVNAEITLSGTVDSRWAKRLAEDLVEDVPGVYDIHNRLRIERDQSRARELGAGAPRGDERAQGAGGPGATQAAPATAGERGIAPGMVVVSADNDEIGVVKEVRADDFLVDRFLKRDIYVPFSAVRTTEGGRVILTMTVGEIDDANWESPPLADTVERASDTTISPAD
jgi:hypothetical protein